jgi:type I restriction enzyme M protein
MVEVMRPKTGDAIHDPACGTGGFLLAAHEYLSKHYELDSDQKKHLRFDALSGFDIVDGVTRLCAMNLYLHGIGGDNSPVTTYDSLEDSANLPEPAIIATEIAEDLEAAFEQFSEIANDLKS